MSNKKNKGGRPPAYSTPEEMEEAIADYFENCDKNEILPSMTHLAVALGMHRSKLYEYEKADEFRDTIKTARERVEYRWIQQLATKQATGAIFMLKNFGWSDKQEHEVRSMEFEVTNEDEE